MLCVHPFLVLYRGVRARDDIQTSETSICSSKELLNLDFFAPCVATIIETHMVAVAMAVAKALDMLVAMALDMAVAMAVDAALAGALDIAVDKSSTLVLPAVDAGRFPKKMLFILRLEHN